MITILPHFHNLKKQIQEENFLISNIQILFDMELEQNYLQTPIIVISKSLIDKYSITLKQKLKKTPNNVPEDSKINNFIMRNIMTNLTQGDKQDTNQFLKKYAISILAYTGFPSRSYFYLFEQPIKVNYGNKNIQYPSVVNAASMLPNYQKSSLPKNSLFGGRGLIRTIIKQPDLKIKYENYKNLFINQLNNQKDYQLTSIVIDTETTNVDNENCCDETDIKIERTRVDIKKQRLVSIAWKIIKFDFLQKNIADQSFESKYYVVRPEGFTISKESWEIHHISTEQANTIGVDLKHVLRDLCEDIKLYQVQEIVAHNVSFDLAVIKKELDKMKEEPFIEYLQLIKEKEISVFCTCRMNFYMTLIDLYMHFFKEPFIQHHAQTDMEACCRIYIELVVNWIKYDTEFWMQPYKENIEKMGKNQIVNQWKFTYAYYPQKRFNDFPYEHNNNQEEYDNQCGLTYEQ